eukprot:jgi/Tetstr1/430955/TSEL_020710.t1
MVQTAAGCCWERGLDHKQLKAQLLETQAAVGLRLKANSEKLEELQSSMEVNYRRRATREEKDASACGACPKEHSVDRILDELHALVVQLSPQLANSSVEGAARINANNGSSLTPRQLFGKPSARSQHGRDRLPPDSANSLATPHDVELRSWTSGRSQHCRRRSLTGAELSEKEQPEWAHKRVSLGTVSSIPYECSTDSGSHEALDDQSFTFDSQSDAS